MYYAILALIATIILSVISNYAMCSTQHTPNIKIKENVNQNNLEVVNTGGYYWINPNNDFTNNINNENSIENINNINSNGENKVIYSNQNNLNTNQNNLNNINSNYQYWINPKYEHLFSKNTSNTLNPTKNIKNINYKKEKNITNSKNNLNNTGNNLQYQTTPIYRNSTDNNAINTSNSVENANTSSNKNNNRINFDKSENLQCNLNNINPNRRNTININQQYPYQQYNNFSRVPNIENQLHYINLKVLNICFFKQIYYNNQYFQTILNNQMQINHSINNLSSKISGVYQREQSANKKLDELTNKVSQQEEKK